MIYFFYSNEQEEHKTLQSAVDNTKKFVQKELETSEKLTEFKERLLRDLTNIDKQGKTSVKSLGCSSLLTDSNYIL